MAGNLIHEDGGSIHHSKEPDGRFVIVEKSRHHATLLLAHLEIQCLQLHIQIEQALAQQL